MPRKDEKRKIVYQKTDALLAYENNSRRHSSEQIKQIANSMERWGFTNPILVDERSILIAGHARLEAARKLNLTEVPTIILKGLTDAERRAYVIADNKLALNATWDFDVLVDEMKALSELDFEIDLTGFSEMEQASFLDPGAVVDLEAEWDGMPEFDQQDKTARHSIIVHFKETKDREAFAELVGQTLTDKTKSIWYQQAEIKCEPIAKRESF